MSNEQAKAGGAPVLPDGTKAIGFEPGSAGVSPASTSLTNDPVIRSRSRAGRALTNSAGRTRSNAGGALLELASIAWILPVSAMLALNATMVGFAAWVNDSACRDVARAAAQQPSADKAKKAASRALKAFATQSQYAVSPTLIMKKPFFEYETFPDEHGKTQLEKGPYVKVSTSMEVRLCVPVLFLNDGLSERIVFNQSYTYPLLNPGDLSQGGPGADYGSNSSGIADAGDQLTM